MKCSTPEPPPTHSSPESVAAAAGRGLFASGGAGSTRPVFLGCEIGCRQMEAVMLAICMIMELVRTAVSLSWMYTLNCTPGALACAIMWWLNMAQVAFTWKEGSGFMDQIKLQRS